MIFHAQSHYNAFVCLNLVMLLIYKRVIYLSNSKDHVILLYFLLLLAADSCLFCIQYMCINAHHNESGEKKRTTGNENDANILADVLCKLFHFALFLFRALSLSLSLSMCTCVIPNSHLFTQCKCKCRKQNVRKRVMKSCE